jgi:preprotein translocase subunit SecD
MSFDLLPTLVAQATTTTSTTGSSPLEAVLLVVGVFIAPIVAGFLIANALRLPDYGWKLALIFFTIVASVSQIYFRWPPALGVDLKGGVILVYEIDEEQTQVQSADSSAVTPSGSGPAFQVNMSELATAISKRLNPTGLKETVVQISDDQSGSARIHDRRG